MAPEGPDLGPARLPVRPGDVNYVGSAKQTIDAVRALGEKFPLTKTILGISNVSFASRPPAARR